jgi:hypothetical protein
LFSVLDRFECLADEVLVRERPVDLRGVEERDAALDGGADEGDPLVLRRTRRKLWLSPMQPSPIAETSRLLPSMLLFMSSPLGGVSA